MIWLSPWSSWVRVLADRGRESQTMKHRQYNDVPPMIQWYGAWQYLMMLAAAFLSWVNSSGSCITSSRKAITFVFSSLLLSKSWRGTCKTDTCAHHTHYCSVNNKILPKAVRKDFSLFNVNYLASFAFSVLHIPSTKQILSDRYYGLLLSIILWFKYLILASCNREDITMLKNQLKSIS